MSLLDLLLDGVGFLVELVLDTALSSDEESSDGDSTPSEET